MTIRFITHNVASQGLRNIRAVLSGQDVTSFAYDNTHHVTGASTERLNNNLFINWGRSTPLIIGDYIRHHDRIVNKPTAVAKAVNKLTFFNTVTEWNRNVRDTQDVILIPNFTDNVIVTNRWYNNGHTVVGRSNLTGHSGDGITLYSISLNTGAPEAGLPLYAQYIKKRKEYRVHVMGNNILDVQEKRRVIPETPRALDFQSLMIRSHANDWVFCRENLDIVNRNVLEKQAILAIKACGLDFGAVDIIWNERSNTYYVLEVNTAVGAEGTTAQLYANAFANLHNNR